jgi:NADPH:quinone reductase-like Zn-dependent oxidoreductase
MPKNSISGEVIAVGEGVDAGVVGEMVMALLSGGGYAEYATVHVRHTLPVPSGLTIQATVARWPCFMPPKALKSCGLLQSCKTKRNGAAPLTIIIFCCRSESVLV